MLNIDVEGFAWHITLVNKSGLGLIFVIVLFCLSIEVNFVDEKGKGQYWLYIDLRESLLHMEDFSLVIFIFHIR